MTAQESTHGAIATPAPPPPPAAPGTAEAVLLATSASAGGPTAALQLDGETLLDRLHGQLASLGVGLVHVVTRPGPAEGTGRARRHESAGTAVDLRIVAEIARGGAGTLVVAPADLVAHREALAGLLADPRLGTAILAAADGGFAGVLKVAAGDRGALAAVAERLADAAVAGEVAAPVLVGPSPEDASAEGDVPALLLAGLVREDVAVGVTRLRGLVCRRALSREDARRAAGELAAVDEERVRLESAVKDTDGFFTTFFVSPYSKYLARWAARRGLTPNQVTAASALIGAGAAVAFAFGTRAGLVAGAVLLQLSFTTDCVDGQLARYTRRFSKLGAWLDAMLDRAKEYAVYAGLALGGARAGEDLWVLAGAALTLQTFRHTLELSYQTASRGALRSTRWGALGQVAGPPLAPSSDRPSPAAPDRGPLQSAIRSGRAVAQLPGAVWVRKAIAFPIGERFAVISLTAALGSPRLTFAVLLAWGSVAAVYTVAGRVLRSLAGAAGPARAATAPPPRAATAPPPRAATAPPPRAASAQPARALVLYRDDGLFARALARLGSRRAPALVPLLAAAVPMTVLLCADGDEAPRALLAAAAAWAVVLAGLSRGCSHAGRLAWPVPPALRALEYGSVVGIAAAAASPAAAFALIAVVAYRHYDLIYRLQQQGEPPPAWVSRASGGWDGRLVVVCLLMLAGLLPAALFALAGALAVVLVGESVHGWMRFARAGRRVAEVEDGEAA